MDCRGFESVPPQWKASDWTPWAMCKVVCGLGAGIRVLKSCSSFQVPPKLPYRVYSYKPTFIVRVHITLHLLRVSAHPGAIFTESAGRAKTVRARAHTHTHIHRTASDCLADDARVCVLCDLRCETDMTNPAFYVLTVVLYCIVLYCIMVGSRRLMPPDALQPKAYCTNPGL